VPPDASPAAFRATYRLQLRSAPRLPRRKRLRPYLRDLGVSHLYLSPVLEARAGSTHGRRWLATARARSSG
jgi:(1->4)-alpha-D-glucan 1-alpha-D-glucosylmutase